MPAGGMGTGITCGGLLTDVSMMGGFLITMVTRSP